MNSTLTLYQDPPKQITTQKEAAEAVEWLRAKKQFDKTVEEYFSEAKKAGQMAHKTIVALEKTTKAASDAKSLELRTKLEAYAERPENTLPEGVFRRKEYVFVITDPELVPEAFKIPDNAKIHDFIKKTEGAIPISGVKIYPPQTALTIRSEE